VSRERYHRARLAGGGHLRDEDWSKTVDRAIEIADASRPTWQEMAAMSPGFGRKVVEHVALAPGQMVVSAQLVLDVEAALSEANTLHMELRELAEHHDVGVARRERIAAKIEDAIAKIKKRLASEPS
jgi:hypothetical protein